MRVKSFLIFFLIAYIQIQNVQSQACADGTDFESAKCDLAGTCTAYAFSTATVSVTGKLSATVNASTRTCDTGGAIKADCSAAGLCVYGAAGSHTGAPFAGVCGDLSASTVGLVNYIGATADATILLDDGSFNCIFSAAASNCPSTYCKIASFALTTGTTHACLHTTLGIYKFEMSGRGYGDPSLDGSETCSTTYTDNSCVAQTQCFGKDTSGTYNVCYDIATTSNYDSSDNSILRDNTVNAGTDLDHITDAGSKCLRKSNCPSTNGTYVVSKHGKKTCTKFGNTNIYSRHFLYLQEYVYNDSSSTSDYFLIQFKCGAPNATSCATLSVAAGDDLSLTTYGGVDNWIIARETCINNNNPSSTAAADKGSLIVPNTNTGYANTNFVGTVTFKITDNTQFEKRFKKYLVSPFEINTRFHYVLHFLPFDLSTSNAACATSVNNTTGLATAAATFFPNTIAAKLKFFTGAKEAENFYNTITQSRANGGKLWVKPNGSGTWPDIESSVNTTLFLLNDVDNGGADTADEVYVDVDELWKCGAGAAICR